MLKCRRSCDGCNRKGARCQFTSVGEVGSVTSRSTAGECSEYLKKARTRAQAIKAESVIQNKLFENKYKVEKRPEVRFDKFVKDHFLPYSELHKRTYPDDVLVCNMLFETFGRVNISEINPPMIEKFKQKRLEGETMYKRKRNPATVNRELCVLSKIFSLAFDAEMIDSNPCRRVRKFRTDTRRTRYLTFDEEARLFEKLEGQEWVQRIVTMAINTRNATRRDFRSHLVRRGLDREACSTFVFPRTEKIVSFPSIRRFARCWKDFRAQANMSFRVRRPKVVLST